MNKHEVVEYLLAGAIVGFIFTFLFFKIWLNIKYAEARAKAEEMEGILRDKFMNAIKAAADHKKNQDAADKFVAGHPVFKDENGKSAGPSILGGSITDSLPDRKMDMGDEDCAGPAENWEERTNQQVAERFAGRYPGPKQDPQY